MESLNEQYEKVVEERVKLIKQIDDLQKDENVKLYLELISQNKQLTDKQEKLYKKLKTEEYASCNHIWITALHDYDNNYCGCIKCGLDQIVFRPDCHTNYHLLTLDQKIMYDFFELNDRLALRQGIKTKIFCDLDLAKAIYSRIKNSHPNIDDKTAIKYFKVALNDIRHIKVSKERKKNRAKRLSLGPNFKNWKAKDVMK